MQSEAIALSVKSEMQAVYSDPLPCESCRYCLRPVDGISMARNLFCKRFPDMKNPKPFGVLFKNEECKQYREKKKLTD